MARPNLLFIFTDEQRYDTMAAYGNSRIETPHMERLARQSCRFEQAYVTQPVCTPSRSSLMSGLYPHTNGCTENNIPLRPDTPCLPEMLRDSYATAYHGKWHLGDEIFAQHGFDEWRAIDDGYAGYYRPDKDRDARSTYHHWLAGHGFQPANGHAFSRAECLRIPEAYSKPAYLGETASAFIRDHQHEPWLLTVNFFEPHMPFFGPRDAQHPLDEVTLPASFDRPPQADQPVKTRAFHWGYYQGGHSGLPLRTEDDWRRLIANYWGLCSLVDTYLGRILDTLEATGQAENTIVVYTSDHGDMMGAHRLLAKCVQFEEAARVPLLVKLPGQRRGKVVTGPVSQIDLVPTLLDLMGQPIPSHLQGRSLKSEIETPGDVRLQDDVVYEWNGPNTGFGDKLNAVVVPPYLKQVAHPAHLAAGMRDPVRTLVTPEGWKFTCSPLGEHELYFLPDDPGELRNLAGDPGRLPLLRQLRDRLLTWQERTGDTVELPVL